MLTLSVKKKLDIIARVSISAVKTRHQRLPHGCWSGRQISAAAKFLMRAEPLVQYDPPFRIVPMAERNRDYAWLEPEIVVQSNFANGRAAANYGTPSFERCASDYGASPNSHRRFALKALLPLSSQQPRTTAPTVVLLRSE